MMKTLRGLFLWLLLLVILFVGGLVATQEIVVRLVIAGKVDRQVYDMRSLLPTFTADQKLLETSYLLSSHTLRKNAGKLLNPLLGWQNGLPAPARDVAGVVYDRLHIPVPVQIRLDEWDIFPSEYEKWEVKEFNLAWMRDLLSYDYWDLEEDHPIHRQMFTDVLENRMPVLDYLKKRPTPLLDDMTRFAKLRVIQAFQARQPIPALQELRHLARLCYSTERSAGAKVALDILQLEQKAYDWLTRYNLIKPTDWQPPGPEALAAARRVVENAEKYMSLFAPDEIFESLFKYDGMKVGRCMAINEATFTIAFYEGNLREPHPFERNYEKRLGEFREAVKTTPATCRMKAVREIWTRGFETFYPGEERVSLDWPNLHLVSQRIPFLRNAVGLSLAASGKKNALNR